jgi:hypothetical protein
MLKVPLWSRPNLKGAAAAGLSPSRQWVLAALQAGGDLQTVKQLGDRLAEAVTRSHRRRPRWGSGTP